MDLCGPNAECFNTHPNYSCICRDGFISDTGVERFHHGDNVTCIGKAANQRLKVKINPVMYVYTVNPRYNEAKSEQQ